MTRLIEFLSDDAGAVTIDWVALGSAILLLGIMVVYSIFNNGVSTLVSNVNSTLEGVTTDISTGPAPNMTIDIDTGPAPNMDQTCPKTKKGIKCIK
jgi:hypothetical protein